MNNKDVIIQRIRNWAMRHPCSYDSWWNAQNLLGDVLGWPEWYAEEMMDLYSKMYPVTEEAVAEFNKRHDDIKIMTAKKPSKPKNDYFAVCSPCGDILYPKANKEAWGAITVSRGKCPRCKKMATLIPIDDWEGHGD